LTHLCANTNMLYGRLSALYMSELPFPLMVRICEYPNASLANEWEMFALRMIRSWRQALRARSLMYPNEGLLTSKTVCWAPRNARAACDREFEPTAQRSEFVLPCIMYQAVRVWSATAVVSASLHPENVGLMAEYCLFSLELNLEQRSFDNASARFQRFRN
jgi:hypothetical protein